MDLKIRLAKDSDLGDYTRFFQKTFQDTYVDDKLGLTKECFSVEVFNGPTHQKYLASNLENNENQMSWVAFVDDKLVGSAVITRREDDYEIKGFYVSTKYQGKGIGKELWKLILDYAKDKDITCDIYSHNKKTIELYKKWGFVVDKEKGVFYRHWPEWPKGLEAECVYMRYRH